MAKPNYVVKKVDNRVYYFIGRKTLSEDEMNAMIDEVTADENKNTEATPFTIPKERRNIFANDLKVGIDFCVTKYGATKEQIRAEAVRLFPGIKVETS